MLYLGLDLHGTLLCSDERFPLDCLDEMCSLLDDLSAKVVALTCTGNDLSFVKKVLPDELLARLSGFVLETGCTYASSLDGPEEILVNDEVVGAREELEKRFKGLNSPLVTRFGRRLATISLFTEKPRPFRDEVATKVDAWGFSSIFGVTYSSVAVDIVPLGYDKLRGLRAAAAKEPLVAVADSVNDIPLLGGADYSFAPANLAREAKRELQANGRQIRELAHVDLLTKEILYVSPSAETKGVIEILRKLKSIVQ